MLMFYVSVTFFRDESLSGSDITSKLEPAFLSGLRCTQPLIRAKFFEVFDASMKRRVYERLLYICCSQNWEAMGSHFWIKQCIEVNRLTSTGFYTLQTAEKKHSLLTHTSLFLSQLASCHACHLSCQWLSLIFCLCACFLCVCAVAAAGGVRTKHHHQHQLPGIHAAVHHQRHQLGRQPWPRRLRYGNACQAGAAWEGEQWNQGGGGRETRRHITII